MRFETSDIGKRSSHQPRHFPARCPFYGFRWKENSDRLFDQGNSECGLEFDTHDQCLDELLGESVDYDQCPLARHYHSFLESAAPFIRFCSTEPTSGVEDIGVPFEQKLEQLMRPTG